MNSRTAILNRIREMGKNIPELEFVGVQVDKKIKTALSAITPKDNKELLMQFKTELEAVSGEFYNLKNIQDASELISNFAIQNSATAIGISGEKKCKDIASLIGKSVPDINIVNIKEMDSQSRKNELAETKISIVHPSFALADTGSLVFIYDECCTSLPHFLCETTFAIVNSNQIVANQFVFFDKINSEKSKNMVFITGPSRTADIEKVLVLGAHGPRKLVVLMIEDN